MAGAAYKAPTASPTLANAARLAFTFSSSVCDILLPLSIRPPRELRPPFETQRFDDALTEFTGIAKTSKNVSGAEALYHIAKIHFNKQNYKEAEKSINALISFAYTNDDWNTKGMILIVDCYIAKGELDDAEVILQTIIDGKPKQEYMDELEEKKKARAATQAIAQPDMKVEFKTTEGDKNLFVQPIQATPVLNDSTQVKPVIENPNQKPE